MTAEDRDLSTMTDEALVERARSGDDASFDLLVRRYQQKVYGLALRLVGDPREAEEVLQETFLQVFRKLETYRGDARFWTWLYRIGSNVALMRLRSKKREPSRSLEEYLPRFNEEGRLERLDLDYGRVARADELLERKELAQKALEAIQRLPEAYRAPLVLRDLDELSTMETAKMLDLEPGVVRTRLHRARLMLRGYLGRLLGGEG
ncbi:MAG TPA: sigma-70 family RNA polymerase sigma factor [bacterium]|nr:sigma-70 family RNA polymerase sigma factor [bacterium]